MVFVKSSSVFEIFVLAVHVVYSSLYKEFRYVDKTVMDLLKFLRPVFQLRNQEDTRTPENCLCFLRGEGRRKGPNFPLLPLCPFHAHCSIKSGGEGEKEERRRATHFEEGKSEVTHKRQKKQKFPRPPSRSTKTLSTQTKKTLAMAKRLISRKKHTSSSPT